MLREAVPGDAGPAPPLGRAGLLVIPLALLGALGVVVPLVRVEFARPPLAAPVARSYADELLLHLERPDLDQDTLLAAQALHERLAAAQRSRGGITAQDAAILERMLLRLGRAPR
jgi:hypothetical protein